MIRMPHHDNERATTSTFLLSIAAIIAIVLIVYIVSTKTSSIPSGDNNLVGGALTNAECKAKVSGIGGQTGLRCRVGGVDGCCVDGGQNPDGGNNLIFVS